PPLWRQQGHPSTHAYDKNLNRSGTAEDKPQWLAFRSSVHAKKMLLANAGQVTATWPALPESPRYPRHRTARVPTACETQLSTMQSKRAAHKAPRQRTDPVQLPAAPRVLSNSLMWRASRRRADRKSTRLNSSHVAISYAVFCLKKK